MFKRYLTGAVLALAAVLATNSAVASVNTVGFEDHAAFACTPGDQHDGGLTFANDFYGCYYSTGHPADFPFVPSSTVMGIGYSDTTIYEDDSSVFDLLGFDLSAGVYTVAGDTTLVTGFLHGGGTVQTVLTLNDGFEHHDLNWLDLDAVVFSRPQTNDGYVAFDNIRFDGTGYSTNVSVPEPAEWLVLLLGFSGCGYMLRRARQLAAVEA
jgi:hypothetical protein